MTQWIYEGTATVNNLGDALVVTHPITGRVLANVSLDSAPADIIARLGDASTADMRLNIFADGAIELAE